MRIELKQVTTKDHKFLYDLLSERKSWQSISHKKMPKWIEHVGFVKNKPYKYWYIIKYKGKRAGGVYISHANEIGLFLKEKYRGKGIGSVTLDNLFPRHPEIEVLYANIAPLNTYSLAFFLNRGFKYIETIEKDKKIIQFTFGKFNPYYVSTFSRS